MLWLVPDGKKYFPKLFLCIYKNSSRVLHNRLLAQGLKLNQEFKSPLKHRLHSSQQRDKKSYIY